MKYTWIAMEICTVMMAAIESKFVRTMAERCRRCGADIGFQPLEDCQRFRSASQNRQVSDWLSPNVLASHAGHFHPLQRKKESGSPRTNFELVPLI